VKVSKQHNLELVTHFYPSIINRKHSAISISACQPFFRARKYSFLAKRREAD
jgi:hypothetical protein